MRPAAPARPGDVSAGAFSSRECPGWGGLGLPGPAWAEQGGGRAGGGGGPELRGAAGSESSCPAALGPVRAC